MGHEPTQNTVSIWQDPEDGGRVFGYSIRNAVIEILEEQPSDVAATTVAIDKVLQTLDGHLEKNKEKSKTREVLLEARTALLKLRPRS